MGQQQYHEVSCISIHTQVSVAVPCQNLVCYIDYFQWGSKFFRGKIWMVNRLDQKLFTQNLFQLTF